MAEQAKAQEAPPTEGKKNLFIVIAAAMISLAILGAAASGAAFVNAGTNGASLGMALLTALALGCQVVNLFLLAGRCPQPPMTQGTSQGS